MEKWEDFKGAFGDGTNVTDVLAFTADATPRNAVLPLAFVDQYVRIQVLGTSLQYYFSSSPSASIVAAVPTATVQQAATLGEVVPAGVVAKVRVPNVFSSAGVRQPMYFVWVCAGAGGGVWVTKDSGVPGLLVGDR
jgi:hypothetical protein